MYNPTAIGEEFESQLDDILMDMLTTNYQTKYDKYLDIEVIVDAEPTVEKAKSDIIALFNNKGKES